MNTSHEISSDGVRVRLAVPTYQEVCCFLERQRTEVLDEREEYDILEGEFLEGEFMDEDDESQDSVPVEEIDEEDVWMIANVFGIGRYSPSWWVIDDLTEHGETCDCRPLGLLEVLHDHAQGSDRQEALEAHLAALRDVWDHFWSGDGLINGASEHIGGACGSCIVEGREHLSNVLDEARNLAEELGEALAAFHSQIDIGVNRYYKRQTGE